MKNTIKVKAEFDIVIRPTNYAQYQKLKEFQQSCRDDVYESYCLGTEERVRAAISQSINEFQNDVLTEVRNCHIKTMLIMEGDEP